MKDGHFIDGEIQKVIQSGRQKWPDILKCTLQSILFVQRNNPALRVSNYKTGAPNAGVSLDITKVISYHNTPLKDMISKHNAGSVNYFSNHHHHHLHGLGFLKACSGFKVSYKSFLKLNPMSILKLLSPSSTRVSQMKTVKLR
jgi:hypothetical protein